MLRERGVQVDDSEPNRWVVAPGPIRALDTAIEPDLSNAAPFLAAAVIPGGSVTVTGWPTETTQPVDHHNRSIPRVIVERIHPIDDVVVQLDVGHVVSIALLR